MPRKPYLFSALCALSLTLASFTPAAADESNSPDPAERHCVTHLKRTASGVAEVAARSCAASEKAAYAALPSDTRTQAMDTKLLTIYQHADWAGSSDSFTGDAPCDSAGYRINTAWSDANIVYGTSSYRTYNNCNGSRVYFWDFEIDHCIDGVGDVRYVGDECNDHVFSMRVYRAF